MSKPILVIAALLLAVTGCAAPTPPDYAAQYRPLVDTYIAAWNAGDLDSLDSAFLEDSKRHSSGGMTTESRADLKALMAEFRSAYPDGKVVLDESHYLDGQSFHLWTFTGTNTGPGPGEMQPTGKSVTVSGMTRMRYRDGKISEELVYFDALDMQTQLGYTLTPPEAATAGG